ncbi:hypothetical protein H0X48_02145 [Candidatus Dependentiae bacterium]|nr:hypothetical protein [Candidatus Dependentiae bacterium]
MPFKKNIHYYLITFLVCLVVIQVQAQATTNDIAIKMGYYDYVRNLRNKSTDHIRALESLLKNSTDTLRSERRSQMANERDLEYRSNLANLQNKFDTAFEVVDQDLIFHGDELDTNNASIPEKQTFIQSKKDTITRAINHIIEQST